MIECCTEVTIMGYKIFGSRNRQERTYGKQNTKEQMSECGKNRMKQE